MGGQIDFTALPEGGTCFTFDTAMAREDARPHTEARLALDAPAPRSAPQILVVDDNQTNRTVLLTLLGHLGVDAQSAADGREALTMWQTQTWDAILMDIHMPVMDGVEASRAIRTSERQVGRPRTPILAVTASVLNHEQTLYSDAGMDGFVAKPIEITRLVEALSQALPPGDAQYGGPVECQDRVRGGT